MVVSFVQIMVVSFVKIMFVCWSIMAVFRSVGSFVRSVVRRWAWLYLEDLHSGERSGDGFR